VAPRCDPRSEEVARVACGTAVTDRMVIVDSLEEALGDTTGET
jgi:tRNA C32,U32 (ribose-2'-O)-methylase TrmJ